VKVSDEYGYNEYLLEVNITGVNDAPRITPSPNNKNVLVLDGKTWMFTADVFDVDGDAVEIEWKLNGEVKSHDLLTYSTKGSAFTTLQSLIRMDLK